MSTLALSLGMKSFKQLCVRFSAERAIMVRGRPGIGKSQSVYQIAADLRSDLYVNEKTCRAMSEEFHAEASFKKAIKRFWKKNGKNEKYANYPRDIWHHDMGLPVVERRLSQLTEGDIVGIPFDGGIGTVFKPTEWLILTCHFPCVLFLDELNRAIKGVEQATFQIADSKAFYGHLLNEETRVYVACNIGDAFDVTPMDPAAISRYAVIDLDPSMEDWLDWARDNCNGALVEFIRANPRLLENKEEFEPNKKYPDRRAWANLDAELEYANLYENVSDRVFIDMSASMVGFAAANSFWDFCKNRATDISALDIVKDWKLAKKRLPAVGTEKYTQKMVELSGKISDHLQKNILTKDSKEPENVGLFMRDAPAEACMTVWLSLSKNNTNLFAVVDHIGDLMVRLTTNQSRVAPPVPATETAPKPPKQRK